MTGKNLLVLFVSVFALAVLASGSVSAALSIDNVVVDGVNDLASVSAGDILEVEVYVSADTVQEEVTVEAFIKGYKEMTVEAKTFAMVDENATRRVVLRVEVPSDIDPDEDLFLHISAYGDGADSDLEIVKLSATREPNALEILSVDMSSEVNMGESLAVDVVLKNRGRQFADDVFLRIRIPALGLEEKTYFGDLAPVDDLYDSDKEDAVERRTYIRIPANTEPGLYDVEVEAISDDSFDRISRRILIGGGAQENTIVVTSGTSKTFSTGETETYKLTLVNRGNVVRVFQLGLNAPDMLNVEVSDPLVVVPAGSSRTVEIMASSLVRDDYAFSVDVTSDDGAMVDTKTFSANVVEGQREVQANTTVLLTVILAIIFVVLLVVLIVLLTRKPETKEEFGESYY